MRLVTAVVSLLALVLTVPVQAGLRPNKPRVDVRATPRIAFSPAGVMVVAQLNGGDDIEDFYCPGLEWDWGDGERSLREADCAPFETGMSLERFFSARHVYRQAGEFDVRVTLRRADRSLAMGTVHVTVHGRFANFE